jgi:hypothetical protein
MNVPQKGELVPYKLMAIIAATWHKVVLSEIKCFSFFFTLLD